MDPNTTDPNNQNPVNPPVTPTPTAPTFTPPADLSSVLSNPTPQLQPEPQPEAAPEAFPIQPPQQPDPLIPEPTAMPTWPTPPESVGGSEPQPVPTFTPPQPDTIQPMATTQDIPIQLMPTFTPQNSQDFMSNMPASGQTTSDTNPVDQNPIQPVQIAEPAPTDLSHLIPTQNGNDESSVYTPPLTQPETLVVPPNSDGTVAPNIPTEAKQGFPKWAIGTAVALLVIIAAASAYFILGIGQPQQTSLPATQIQQAPATAPAAVITSAPPAPAATSSASFGQFQAPTPPSSTTSGTSAADILRQRLGR